MGESVLRPPNYFRTAQAQADGGVNGLQQFMSANQLKAFNANPASGSRFLGTAAHKATAQALEAQYPGRFSYNRVGPDFLDTMTGEMIELTTPGQVGAHIAKGGAYTGATYSTYLLPRVP